MTTIKNMVSLGKKVNFEGWNFDDEFPEQMALWLNEVLARRIETVFESGNGAETTIVVDVEAINRYNIPFVVALDISGDFDNFAESKTSVREVVMDGINYAAEIYSIDVRVQVSEALLKIAQDVLVAEIPGFTKLKENP